MSCPPRVSRAFLIFVATWWAGEAGAFSCTNIYGKKLWKHAPVSAAPVYSTGVVLNPVHQTKAQRDARTFEQEKDEDLARRLSLPEFFDARQAWRYCPSISRIVDQGCCGSCWAYASALAMADRHCIHAREYFEFSAEHLLECSKVGRGGSGCHGGDPADAFDYWTTRGVVSGGDFNSSVGCVPYSVPPSGPHCRMPATTTYCREVCQPHHPTSFYENLRYGDRYMLLPFNRSIVMQAEIFHSGPIVTILNVHEDFSCYKEGIYEHVTGLYQGAHAVRLIGWGTEKGVPYWLAANTWGSTWGEKGFFRIKRGVDECKIESIRVVTGYPANVNTLVKKDGK